MSMKSMLQLKENLCTELDKFSRKENLSTQDMEAIQKLTSSIKNIGKIGEMEMEGMYEEETASHRGGRSYRGDWPMMYDGGSYRRGVPGTGRHYRDGDGGSYHGDREWLIREIDRTSSYASGEREKRILQEAMDKIRNG